MMPEFDRGALVWILLPPENESVWVKASKLLRTEPLNETLLVDPNVLFEESTENKIGEASADPPSNVVMMNKVALTCHA